MDGESARREIEALLREWQRSIDDRDPAAAAALRSSNYEAHLPGGTVLSGQAEIDRLLSSDVPMPSPAIRAIDVAEGFDSAVLLADVVAPSSFAPDGYSYRWKLELRKSGGAWRAVRSSVEQGGDPEPDPTRASGGLQGRARRLAGRLRRSVVGPSPSFQDLAYQPYRPGEDYVLPLAAEPSTGMPIPPRSLWLGYNYPAHGALHVHRMLELLGESGFAPEEGERVLDFGCGAGRLIRHLSHFADRCEIWGTDISAEHINWCRQNLSPPFRFATTTKVPHLPFEDRSFGLVYCGSVFTHIDDLADAWLLELHRILRPGGRLYVTLHDEHSIGLFGKEPYSKAAYVRRMVAEETFQAAVRQGFGMFTVGRDEESQVFYDSRFFARMAGSMFDVLSIAPEAYFYQTAYVLKRRETARGEAQ